VRTKKTTATARRAARAEPGRGSARTTPAAADPLERLLRQKLVVCLGSGGVGKTTAAAALAVAGAARRASTAVITVDPARRLKDALGLEELGTDPQRVSLDGVDGRLDALALDTKRTFDALIERAAPAPEIAARIRANRLYRELSNELGGSTEYMAMEKLHELLHQGIYDLVVVDTPPSSHARDLLSAPLRMSALLASSAVRILKTPASLLWGADTRLGRATMTALLKALERWTGMHLLQDLSDFAANFEHLADGFRTRAQEIELALHRTDTSFVLVTTPEPDTVAATIELERELRDGRFPIAGVIANRVYDFAPVAEDAGRSYPEPLRRKLLTNYADFAALGARDRRSLRRLRNESEVPLLAALPVLEEPPTSLRSLQAFAAMLGPGKSALPARAPV
jgi:anion-transporting  ArsA/GET3 family ATPase